MKRWAVYFLLQLKRVVRTLPFVIAITLSLITAICIILSGFISEAQNDGTNQKISVAIVGDTKAEYLGFGISLLQNMDISRHTVDFKEMSEGEAEKALDKGEIGAYVVIPDGFVKEALSGNVLRLKFVTSGNPSDIVSIFKSEMLDAISTMLVESQKGVYGMQSVMYKQNDFADWRANTDSLFIDYFGLILNRSLVYEEEITGISDGLSFSGYIISALTVLFMLICALPFSRLFIRSDSAILKLMKSRSRTEISCILGEYAAYLTAMLICVFSAMSLFFLMAGRLPVPELSDMTVSDGAVLLLSLIPAVLVITSFQFLLFEISSNIASGIILQFLTCIALAYIGGCFYPISFFPSAIQALSKLLPSGMARSYISHCLVSNQSIGETAVLLLTTALFIFLTATVRKIKITHS